MDPASALVVPLSSASALGNTRVGGKAAKLSMSHIMPLAAAIAYGRGGMLIHGAIIARELGVPCFNGVSDAILETDDGVIVTVDGHLGIVTIGAPEFDLEAQAHSTPGERFE